MRAVLIVYVLFPYWSTVTNAVQLAKPGAQNTVTGSVLNTDASPVELSDATYTLENKESEPQTFHVAQAVKIRNVSGRAIRRLSLRFVLHHASVSEDICSASMIDHVAVDRIAAAETRDFTTNHLTLGLTGKNDLTLTVLAAGVEFEDGLHWAAPRRELCPLFRESLSQPGSFLMIRECTLTDSSYSCTLEVADPQIVAYRLGLVSDTESGFVVRKGVWVELSHLERVRGARFVDAGKSLSPELLFPRETSVSTVQGKQVTNLAGVALFVAELRFADGRRWRQDTTRDSLFWDN